MNYRILLLQILHAFVFTTVSAQKKIYQIKADSVRIFSSCDTAELILENRTRTLLNGVLTNKADGITEFRKVMVTLNDSLYTIGGDTLNTAAFGKNIYNTNGIVLSDRVVDGNNKNIRFDNNNSYLIANNARPVIISRTPMDSLLRSRINSFTASPFSGLAVRGTGCDAVVNLVSDSAGTCNESQAIDFVTLKPRGDSWLTKLASSNTGVDKFLLGRIILQTQNQLPDYSTLSFTVKSDTAFHHDGAYTLYTPGTAGGYTPNPVLSINPSFKHPVLGYNTRMPFVQVNGGLFVGYGRNWYYNSKNANDIISGVDDVPGYLQSFYETRFSVYADSLPLKIYKLPAIEGSAFLTYSPGRSVDGNNVAFEYKDSVYEQVRNYISLRGISTPSDSGLKENIMESQFDGRRLLGLSVKDFNYKADHAKIRHTGLIAQELQLQVPELVLGKEGCYSIDYTRMVPYLLKILQEQQRQILRLSVREQMLTSTIAAPSEIAQMKLQIQQLQEALAQQQQTIKQFGE